jgi:hypothetical protein
MRTTLLWLMSTVMVAVITAVLTLVVARRTSTVDVISDALPWTLGSQSAVTLSDGKIHAQGAFINLPVSCDVFSPSRAALFADEAIITRGSNTYREVDIELRGSVHLRYTVRHN